MKNFKGTRWMSLIIALMLMAAVFSGCSSSKNNEPANTANTTTPEVKDVTTANTPAPEVKEDPFKITIMTPLKDPEVPTDKIEKILEEKTNTDLTIQWVPDGTYDEKFQASFATGGLPQVVYIKNAASFVLLRNAIVDGQYWEVGPYLKDYPNLQNLNPAVLKNTSVKGKIYSLYQERPLARNGIIYRKDWADKLGISAPTTTEDIYNMLKKFKESDLAGGGNTVGLADRSDLVYGAFKTLSSYFGTPNSWGEADGKLVPEFMTQGYMDTMNFVKKLHDEKLINSDFPVTSKTDQQNMMYTGKAGMYIGSMPDVKSIIQKTLPNVPDAIYDVDNSVVNPDGKQALWSLPGYGTLVVFPKSAVKTEADLKKILAFYDSFFGPDVANLLKYGVEGTHYTMVDGSAQPVDDAKLLQSELKAYQSLALADTTNIITPKYTLPAEQKAQELTLAAAATAIPDPTLPLDSKTYTEKGAKLQTAINDATYKYMLGNIDAKGFQAEIDKWKADGGQAIMDEFNAQYNK